MSWLSLGRGLGVLTALAGSSVSLALEVAAPSSFPDSLPCLEGAAEALWSQEKLPGGGGAGPGRWSVPPCTSPRWDVGACAHCRGWQACAQEEGLSHEGRKVCGRVSEQTGRATQHCCLRREPTRSLAVPGVATGAMGLRTRCAG